MLYISNHHKFYVHTNYLQESYFKQFYQFKLFLCIMIVSCIPLNAKIRFFIGEALNRSVSVMTELAEGHKMRELELEKEIRALKEKLILDNASLCSSRANRLSLEAASGTSLSDLKESIQSARHLCDEKDRELDELGVRFASLLQVCFCTQSYLIGEFSFLIH